MENFEVSNEQTNQAELESFEGENLTECENTDELSDNPLGVSEDDFKEEASKKEESYTVKYNGRELSLSLDELKTNAQKGLNYDHIRGELESIKKSPVMSVLDSLAREKKMTREEFVLSLAGEGEKKREGELLELGLSKSEAKRIAKLENSEKERLLLAEQEKPYIEFAKKFPDVCGEDIPAEVWQEFEKSGNLIGAYMDYENRRLSKEIKMLEQNRQNEQKSLGAADSSGKASTDPFLEGLYS